AVPRGGERAVGVFDLEGPRARVADVGLVAAAPAPDILPIERPAEGRPLRGARRDPPGLDVRAETDGVHERVAIELQRVRGLKARLDFRDQDLWQHLALRERAAGEAPGEEESRSQSQGR